MKIIKLKRKFIDYFYIVLYHLLEHIDGERRGLRILPYPQAERMKLAVLRHTSTRDASHTPPRGGVLRERIRLSLLKKR